MRKHSYKNTEYSLGAMPELPLSFALLLCLCALTFDAGMTLALLLCVCVHESGHLLAARLLGAEDIRLRPGPFGFEISCAPLSLSPVRQCAAALSGPCAGLLLGLLFSAAASPFWQTVSSFSLWLALVNLLPVAILDGGVAVNSALQCAVDISLADRLCFVLDVLTLSLLFASAMGAFCTGRGAAVFIFPVCLTISYCGNA